MAGELSAEVLEFLSGRHDAVLATIGRDGVPQQTLLWYEYRDGQVIMNTAAGRIKDRNMRRDPRISVCVVAEAKAVTFRGTVEIIDDQEIAQRDIYQLAIRYNGTEVAERQARDQFRKEHRVTLRLRVRQAVLQGFD
jgi:PPOX class probable F420-dependent enzyme